MTANRNSEINVNDESSRLSILGNADFNEQSKLNVKNGTATFNGSANFNAQSQFNSTGGVTTFNDQVNFNGQSQFNGTGGVTTFNGQVNFNNRSQFNSTGGVANFKNINIKNYAQFNIANSVNISEEFKLYNQAVVSLNTDGILNLTGTSKYIRWNVLKKASDSGTVTVNFNGGTLSVNDSAIDTIEVFGFFSHTDNINLQQTSKIDVANNKLLVFNHGSTIKGDTPEANLEKVGAGTLIFAGNNTYVGKTIIQEGTLQLGNESGSFGSPAGKAGTSGTAGTGEIIIKQNANLKIKRSDSYSLDNTITDAGNLEQAGSGKTIVTKNDTYTGKTTVSNGELEIANNASINGTSDVLVDSGKTYSAATDDQAKLTVNGTLTTAKSGDDSGDVVLKHGLFTVNGSATVGNIKSTTGAENQLAKVNVTSGGTLTTNLVAGDTLFENFKTSPAPDTVIIDGTWNANVASGTTVKQDSNTAITDTNIGMMNKTGAGTLVLTADNSNFKGTININAGTLQAGDGGTTGTFGSGNITIANGATAAVNRSNEYTLVNKITGAGTLQQDGSSTLKLTNAENSVGNTVVNNGTLEVVANLASTNVHINNGNLTVDNNVELSSTTVNVGNSSGAENTAKLVNNGILKDIATINVKSDGYLNQSGTQTKKDGTLNVDGGKVDVKADTSFANTNINEGTVTVDNGTKLDGGDIIVGNSDNKVAAVDVKGEVKAENINIAKGGTFNVNGDNGKVTATNNVSMDGGKLNVNAKGTLSASNITSLDNKDEKASTINVAKDSTLNLTPKDGDKLLFDGFNTTVGGQDNINIDGTLNLNVDSGTVTQSVNAPISGTGTFNKNGAGTFDVKANNPFAGTVNANQGTLKISEGGKLGNATVNVSNGATLAVDKNGTSLKNLTLSDKATLSIEATPEGYSKIDVADKATLGGTLYVDTSKTKNDKDLGKANFSNFITADKPIETNFTKVEDSSGLFNFRVEPSSSGKEVSLVPYASTANLVKVSKQFGLDRALDAATVLDKVFHDSPESDLSFKFLSIGYDAQEQANALLATLPTLAGASSQVLADSSKRLADLADIYERCDNTNPQENKHLWVKTFDSWRTQNQYQGAAGYRDNSYGFAVGVEKCHGQTRLGAMIGYPYDKAHSRESVSHQSLRADTIQAGIYGNTPISPLIDLDFRAGIGYSDVSTQRQIAFANRTAKGEYGNKLGYAGIGVNFNAFANDQVEVRPFVRMDYQVVRNNHYQERGAGVLSLKVDADTNQSFISKVGVDTRVRVADKLSVGTRASIGYDLIDEPAFVTAAFQGAPDLKFKTEGAQHGRVSGDVGLNVNYHITPAASLSVGYDASARKGYIEHTPSITFKMAF
ncbi:autotransporter domain-containing protein [Gallibacterium salpingitidis]|uniref:autotransporter domain-containing protein n=1 Tax=Gallibacterium salpingitidis TaxID=505341 RepID=UPI00266F5133|nr:autotransporter domain-containing protein [Gallibacterium salpingitidis]WKT00388.1 autotransporter domain-containing protein [Gallibacterium salpingitidis]